MYHGDEQEGGQRALTAAQITAVVTRARLGAAQRDELFRVREPAGMASEDVVDVLVDVERVAAGLARVLRAIRLDRCASVRRLLATDSPTRPERAADR